MTRDAELDSSGREVTVERLAFHWYRIRHGEQTVQEFGSFPTSVVGIEPGTSAWLWNSFILLRYWDATRGSTAIPDCLWLVCVCVFQLDTQRERKTQWCPCSTSCRQCLLCSLACNITLLIACSGKPPSPYSYCLGKKAEWLIDLLFYSISAQKGYLMPTMVTHHLIMAVMR